MAIIQISKIQQRSGNLVDLPQLDEAQFGWASDAKRLFIGKTTPNENIEVLTSYSNISFSQIDGSDGGNFNIANATNGQVLTYVDTTNTWENWPSTTILTANANFKLDLGDVGNINMGGGATGYILETDGIGNLSWTSKGTLRTVIAALSNATPIIMTVATATPYTNGLAVTVSGANASNANTIVNGKTFYVKVSNNFPTSGNVELYTTSDLAPGNAAVGTGLNSYVANSGIATALIGGSGVSNAGGSVNTIQFNNSGVLNGSANFTITGGNLVTLTGNFSASNIAGGNLVTANFITGRLTTSGQPNITSTGTLAGLVVAGNITPSANITYNLGNNTNRFNDLYLSNSTIYIGAQTISANTSSVIVSGNLVANLTGNVSGNATTAGTVTTAAQPNITSTGTLTSLSVSGNLVANLTGNVSGNATTAGTVITAAQPNITSTGTLVSLSVSGNANISGNVSAGLITLTNGAIIKDTTGNAVSFGENAGTTTQGQSAVAIGINAGSSTQGLSAVAVGNGAGSITQGSDAISIGTDAGALNQGVSGIGLGVQAAFSDQQSDAIAIGRNAGYINQGTAAIAIGVNAGQTFQANNSIIINASGSALNQTVANTFNVAPVRNDVSNVGQILFYNTTSKEITYGNTLSISGNATVLGIKTNNYYYANGASVSFAGTYSNGNVANYLPTFTGTVGATILTTGANTTAGTLTGNWTLSSGSRLQATYADLAEYYEADTEYEPGTVLAFGGEKEVTIAEDGTTRVAGVVSTNPAYAMNANCQGIAVAIALQGRVPTRVRGSVRKGDMMVSAGNGFARPWNNPHVGTVIGKALENFDGIEGVIEVAVGRL